MPTLNAPQSATYVTASPQEFVNVICTGANDVMLVSWVGPAGTSGQRTVRNTTSAGEDIGPLLDGTTVNFLAQAGAPGYSAPAFSPPVQSLVSGDGIVNSRDGLGRVTSYTAGGITYTVTYGNFGPATVSGGGRINTYNYDAAGFLLNVTTA